MCPSLENIGHHRVTQPANACFAAMHAAGPAIDHFQQVETKESPLFWEPLVFAIALAEAWRIGVGWAPPRSENFNQLLNEYDMGELGFDPLGLCPTDPKEKYDMQTKELNNGRWGAMTDRYCVLWMSMVVMQNARAICACRLSHYEREGVCCRLAMIAIIAFIVQELVEKKEIVGQVQERLGGANV